MKNIKKIVMLIIGTLIGAGFASGKEIYIFFYRFGKIGLLGIVISSILTGLIIYLTLKLANRKEIDNYDELIETVNKKYSKISKVIKNIVNLFLIISFYIMVAGFGAYIKQKYNITPYISCSIFTLIIYLILRKNIQGLLKINAILVPIIILLIILLGINNIIGIINKPVFIEIENENTLDWLIYSILYTSYNSIILVPVIITLRRYIQTKNDIISVSIVSSCIINILAICVFFILFNSKIDISSFEMPLLQIVSQYGNIIKNIYGIIIVIAIFTSAISVGFSFIENISNEKTYKRNLFLICISSVFISNIGFSNLIQILYPLFGVIGITQLVFICVKSLEKRTKN